MAFTVSAAAFGDGTISVSVSASPAGTASWTWQNTTTSSPITAVNGSTGSATVGGPKLGVTNTITLKAYSGTGGTGTLLGTTTASATPALLPPGVTATISGTTSGCTWNAASESNSSYSFLNVSLYYRINGGSEVFHSTSSSQSGSIPSTSVTVGYSSTIVWRVSSSYSSASFGTYSPPSGTGSGSTGAAPPPPPSAPNPPTGLTAVDSGTSVALSWTAPVGGANGYEISRGVTVLGTQAGTTKTDSSPGSTRPLTYSVRAYNTNSSGTAYSSSVSIVVGSQDSCGILIG